MKNSKAFGYKENKNIEESMLQTQIDLQRAKALFLSELTSVLKALDIKTIVKHLTKKETKGGEVEGQVEEKEGEGDLLGLVEGTLKRYGGFDD